jgi:hypothetical protein
MPDVAAGETFGGDLIASVMDELNLLDRPPEDEYAALHSNEPPPAYTDNFEDAYSQWCATYDAKRAIAAMDKDPAVANTEKALKEAKETLKDMKEKRYGLFYIRHDDA